MTAKAERGQSMVEFALIVPVFVLILIGLLDVGRAVYASNAINNAARQAARLAIVDQTPQHIRARAAAAAVGVGITEASVVVDFRKVETPDDEGSCDAFVADGNPDATTVGFSRCLAVVTVPYTYQAATPLLGNLIGDIDMIGESRFKLDFYCEGALCPLGE